MERGERSPDPPTRTGNHRAANAAARTEEVIEGPTDLPPRAWGTVLKRTAREFLDDKLTHWAAALTYYAVLSLFPALLVLVSLLGLIGGPAVDPLVENVSEVAPGPAQEIVTGALEGLEQSGDTAGVLLVVGLAGALWAASGYIAGFIDASNSIWDVEEGRPIWKRIPLRLGITALMMVLLAVSAIAVVLTGPLAERAGDVIGIGGTALAVWDIAKWPVLVLVVSLMLALLYWLSPNVKQPGFRWVTPGGVAAIVLWLLASGAFALYVANFGKYNETYGSLGGVIVFLVWLWITNVAVLAGAELNAELERDRQLRLGRLRPPDREPFLPPKDDPDR